MVLEKGFTIGTTSLLPNVMMAFVIIRILDCYRSFTINWRCIPASNGALGSSW